MMKDKSGKITVNFTLDGDINDPNENLASRIGGSVAGALGISLEGLAKGVASAGASAVKGVGEELHEALKKK